MGKKEIAIKVDNLSIRYKSLKSFSIKQNFLRFHKNKRETFEALKNISFEVEEGEILGIIGKNGSGKSTLLRSLANIFSPDEGTIDTYGHSVSLLSIGVGFQKQLSGRENIILSGMLLGFSEEEIRAKMNRIIKFADLGKFIDMPVSTYSSGMYSKLAFSITAILETDIMLIDEVLSVGDRRFKKKSYKKMKDLISDDKRTVVIVSHSIPSLRELCQKVLWINDGEMIMIGEANEVLDKYEAFRWLKIKTEEQSMKKVAVIGLYAIKNAGDNILCEATQYLIKQKNPEVQIVEVDVNPRIKSYKGLELIPF